MDDLTDLTVSEIAERLAPAGNKAAIERITRQLRHWTVSCMLDPAGDRHTGPGRHRRYASETLYVATVLVELSNMGFSIGVLSMVAAIIKLIVNSPRLAPTARDRWCRAIKGEAQVFMVFSPERASADDEVIEAQTVIVEAPGGDLKITSSDEHGIVVLNLTQLFAPLRR